MKKQVARLLVLMVLVVALSWALVKFVGVVHASGCCQSSSGCYNAISGGACMGGDTYYSGYQCCDDGICKSYCGGTTSTTTTSTTTTCRDECSSNSDCGIINDCNVGHCIPAADCGTVCTYSPDDSRCDDGIACTVDTCTSSGCTHTPDDSLCDAGYHCTSSGCEPNLPGHGQVCNPNAQIKCDPNDPHAPLQCMGGGCNGESVCCSISNPTEYAYCDDPPGGIAVSYCAQSGGTNPHCHYCVDLNGEHYNVGDCVTTDPSVCGSGWMKCTDTCDTSQDPPVYEWGCANNPASECPQGGGGGGGGTGGGGTTTTSSTTTFFLATPSLRLRAPLR